ncbi:serine--tRNA ligase [Candidatus Bathyarchaeota archaeon]|nr:serine--tRNA ligase [Candidatus Bathyarchaeota archaeon]
MSEDMRMRLKCTLNLSHGVDKAEKVIDEFVVEANKGFLVKGAPAGQFEKAARILSWNVVDTSITFIIESGSHVRATAAALRIRKALAAVLGAKFKIGIRGLEVSDFVVTLPVLGTVPEATLEKIRKLPSISDVRVEQNHLHLMFRSLTDAELKRGIPDRTLELIEKRLEEALKPKPVVQAPLIPVVRQSPQKAIRFEDDPVKVAIEQGWIKEFPGRGQWIYTPPFACLSEVIESFLIDEIVSKLDFKPFMLPKLIPLEVMKLMPGYLDNIPEGMYYVCPPPRDPDSFERFKEAFKVTREVPRRELKRVIKDPDYVLDPAQCTPLWYFFSHETIDIEDLPYKFYDRSGWTYRWEGGGVEGLVRLQEFRRIELVYFDVPDGVVKIRDSIVDECVRVADRILDLEWRVVAATPFFMRGGEIAGDIYDSRNVAAYDIEIYLPYRGPRETAEWLEIAACFVHKTKFIEAFKIRELKNREFWSGCTGLGVSRWVAAFLSEHGFNPDNWPKEVEKRFNRNNKPPTTLTWPPKR